MALRWEDERYVRLYTRDTATWKLLPWQSKALLPLILRKLDRAGLAEVGEPAEEGIAALTDMPLELVNAALPALLLRRVFDLQEGILRMTNYKAAQEAVSSAAARKREQRERERVVTKRDDLSRDVTDGHEKSRGVTPSLAEPSLAIPKDPPIVPQGGPGFALSAEPDKPAKRGRKDWPAPERPEWLPVEPWDAWLDYRKRGRTAYTNYAQHLTLKALERLRAEGQDPAAVLEQSIRRSWTDVFPVKADDRATPIQMRQPEIDILSKLRPPEEDPDA